MRTRNQNNEESKSPPDPQPSYSSLDTGHLDIPPEPVDPVPTSGKNEIEPDVDEKNLSPSNLTTTIFPKTCAISPGEMTDEERLLEVSDILAVGFLRSRTMQAKHLQNSSASSVNRLAISGNQSIDCAGNTLEVN